MMRSVLQRIANTYKWAFLTAGAIARFVMGCNRPLFKYRTNVEVTNFFYLGSLKKAKRIFRKIGFHPLGCGYPHTRDQLWLNWRFCKQDPEPLQLHARFRKYHGITIISVHVEPDWARAGEHSPNDWHPDGHHYDMGRSYLKRILKRKVNDKVISKKERAALRWIKSKRMVLLHRKNIGVV